MSSLNKFPFGGYGPDEYVFRGTFSGNGSTTASGAPRIDLQFPTSKPPQLQAPAAAQQRFQGYMVLHDAITQGVYDVLLADDFADVLPLITISQRQLWSPGSLFVPVTTTAGDGVLLVANSPTQSQLQVVITISGGGSTVASGAISNGVLTFTMGSATTMATFVTYVNAHSSTVHCTAAVAAGPGTDVMTGSAASAGLFISAGSFFNGAQAYGTIPSTTGGDGITFTGVPSGALGNGIEVIIQADTTLSVTVNGNIITVNLATAGNTNAQVAGAIIASSAATALVTMQVVGPSDTALAGAVTLTGGGETSAQVVGPVDPSALSDNGLSKPVNNFAAIQQSSLAFFHFKVQHLSGGRLIDQQAVGSLFIPSTTRGSGVQITSVQTSPIAATGTVASTTGGDGILYTAVAAGASGNSIGILYNGPYASYFLGSTTSGDGIMFTAATLGSLGTAVSVFCASPNGNTSYCVVNGNAITLLPKTGETNSGLVTVINASSAATALVSVVATGGADLITPAGNSKASFLSGGNTNGSNTATVSVAANVLGGSTIVVNFGASTTNTTVASAVNASAPASALVTASVSAGGSDNVLQTSVQYLTGGLSATDITVTWAVGASTSPSASVSGSVLTITLGTTNANNTNSAIAAAVNQAQASANPLVLAASVGTGSDLWSTARQSSPQRRLQLGSLIEFAVITKENAISAW